MHAESPYKYSIHPEHAGEEIGSDRRMKRFCLLQLPFFQLHIGHDYILCREIASRC